MSDRTGGGKFCEEYEVATTKLEEFSELLKREQQERTDLIKVLEDGEAFYDTSYGEVKVIVHVSNFLQKIMFENLFARDKSLYAKLDT